MSIEPTKKLKWCNIIDNKNLVLGIALIKRGFVAQLHKHKEAENYYFLYGIGRLAIDKKISIIKSYKKIKIPANVPHAMTPISKYVILAYTFRKGPFRKINYQYLDSKL